jgi:cell division inhibitor SepF
MANGKKSFLDYFKVNQTSDEFEDDLFDEDEDEDDDDFDDYEPPKTRVSRSNNPAPAAAAAAPQASQSYQQTVKKTRNTSKNNNSTNKLVSISRPESSSGATASDIFSIQPTRFDDGQIIVNHLIENEVVLVNLEGVDQYTAQRIIDFISGACCAIDAGIRKASEYVFVIAPNGVYLSGDFKDDYDVQRREPQYDSAFSTGAYMNNMNYYQNNNNY